jgi:hypothetical protein
MSLVNAFKCIFICMFSLIPCSKCFSDSYADFGPDLAVSNSFSTIAFNSPSVVPGNAEIIVGTRLHPASKQLLDDVSKLRPLPPSLLEGKIRFTKKITLPYQPSIVRVSDTHLITVDIYGPNNSLQSAGHALTIRDLDNERVVKFELKELVSADLLKSSGARTNWVQDAWFSIDNQYLIIAFGDLVDDGKTRFLQISVLNNEVDRCPQISKLIAQTPRRYYSSLLFCAYRFEMDTENLRTIAEKLSNPDTATALEKVVALCYQSRIVRSEESQKELLAIRKQLRSEFNFEMKASTIESISLANQLGEPLEIAEIELGRLKMK